MLIPFVAVVVLIVVALCVKSCNKATDKPSAETTSSIKEVVTTTANQTQPVSIQSVTIPAQATVSVATVAADNTQPATAAIATVSNSHQNDTKEESRFKSESRNNNNQSNNNHNSNDNQNNNGGNNAGSHSYVTVSKPEYNYSSNQSKDIEVSGISLNYLSKTLTAGESINLSANITPSNATNKSVSWSTSNSNVATVNNGYVVSHSAGTAYITATAGNHSATCTVVVKEKETQDSVYITPAEKYCNINEVITFTLINANNCSFNISNPSAVQIIGGGTNRIQIKAKSRTTVTITATNNSTGREYTAKLIIE